MSKKINLDELELAEETLKGEIVGIDEPEVIETRFGKSVRIPFRIKVNDSEIVVSQLVREESLKKKLLHPRSNLYKLLARYGAKKVKDLIGKKVELRMDSRGFYRFVI